MYSLLHTTKFRVFWKATVSIMFDRIKFSVLASTLIFTSFVVRAQDVEIKKTFDQQKNISTIQLPATRVAYEQGKYHRLDLSLTYSFKGTTPPVETQPIDLELVSVVKARRLNTDLYVEFLIDGKPVHFGSNRSAIRNPVPGRLWMGERMLFSIPYQDLVKFSAAKTLAIRFGDTTFQLNDNHLTLLRKFVSSCRGRHSVGAPSSKHSINKI